MVAIAGSPTGAVFYGGEGFIVRSGNFSGAARFLFASEEGTISAWSSGVPSPAPSKEAIVVVDRRAARSVYKGLAIATGTPRGDLIYATDFRNRRVDVFNARFDHAGLGRGAFFDSAMPDNYAPFGIAHLGNSIFVTYAEQNDEKKDDVKGLGHGYVDQYDLEGRFIRRVATRGQLNSPWGLALAPHDFGNASGELLVGNFGDGRINTYDPKHLTCQNQYRARGLLKDQMGRPLSIDGLWALSFGNGAQAGPENTLFFSAGIHGEEGGLFGSIESDDACGDYTCD